MHRGAKHTSDSTMTLSIHPHYLALKLLVGTSHCWLLTHVYLWVALSPNAALSFVKPGNARSSILSPLYSVGLSMFHSAHTGPSISQSPSSKNHKNHHTSASYYGKPKQFCLPEMTFIVYPFTLKMISPHLQWQINMYLKICVWVCMYSLASPFLSYLLFIPQ